MNVGSTILRAIKVASTINGFYAWPFFLTVTAEKRETDLVSTLATYTDRQGDRDRTTEHAERITCWLPCARQGGGVGGGDRVITFLGQVREHSFSRCFYTNRHKQREHDSNSGHVEAGSGRTEGRCQKHPREAFPCPFILRGQPSGLPWAPRWDVHPLLGTARGDLWDRGEPAAQHLPGAREQWFSQGSQGYKK